LADFVATTGNNNARAFMRESNRSCTSNAREGASDQNNGSIHEAYLLDQKINRAGSGRWHQYGRAY
jgi:hypothetical protein